MSKTPADEFHEDGTRLFNPHRSHGTVYGDAALDGRWVQDGILYSGDRLPVGHVSKKSDAKARASN